MAEVAPRIAADPKIKGGKPVIQGTRIPVYIILGQIAGGASFEEIEREYGVVREDILAAISYAAMRVAEERFLEAKSA
ncbi:MAG: DUF433 domain-containing protein [Bdellovibrionota bacterium]